jgi:hypothetical protein
MQVVPKDPALLKVHLCQLSEISDGKINLQKTLIQPLRVLLRKLREVRFQYFSGNVKALFTLCSCINRWENSNSLVFYTLPWLFDCQ